MAAEPELTAPGAWTCPACQHRYPAEFAVCPRDATPRPAEPTGDPLLGQVLGQTYRITRVLGEGGMARLYEAEHLRIDARVAVKVIHDDLARDGDLLARFEREARAAGRIHSDHVVRLIDVLRTPDQRPCLVTELLEGEDLQAVLDRGKLSVAEALPIARQICRAIADGHAVGVIHRDLKPSNIFLCKLPSGPEVKVFDFGVAKLEDDEKLTRTDAVMGTAAYMAPEQARSAAAADPLADVYSAGAVLYHMLTGQPPYGDVPAFSRLAMVLHEEPARPTALEPAIPAGIEAVIQHAMARDRGARITSALELERQLAAFDPGDAPAAPEVATQIVVRARLARPLALAVAAASSLALGAWLAALLAVVIEPTGGGARGLLGVIAAAAVAGLATLHVRRLRPRWASLPAVVRYIRPAARAVVAGGLTYAALALTATATAAIFGAPAIGLGACLAATGAAAGLGLGWQRLGLDERLRRRIT
jgi:serine/threonine-protein kinase